MKAFLTSIGEPTTDLCKWSLERNGFEVVLLEDKSTLASKLKQIYRMADNDFIRIDADVIPNKYLLPHWSLGQVWWLQFLTFDWYKQRTTHGGVSFIRKEALPFLRQHIDEAMHKERPETHMYRLKEFHNPRRCITQETIVGLQNYRNDLKRVQETKNRRKQDGYDWELAQRLEQL